MRKLPRATGAGAVAIDGRVWNDLCDELERRAKMQVAPPLILTDTVAGILLSLSDERETCIVNVLAPLAGGGKYNGEILNGQGTWNKSNNDPPTMNGNAVPCYVHNIPESNVNSHRITSGTTFVGEFIGFDDDLKPLVSIDDGKWQIAPAILNWSGGGADGTDTTPASYLYTANSIDSLTPFGINLRPKFQRPNGSMKPATYGIVYWDSTFTPAKWQLLCCDEVPNTDVCTTDAGASSVDAFMEYQSYANVIALASP